VAQPLSQFWQAGDVIGSVRTTADLPNSMVEFNNRRTVTIPRLALDIFYLYTKFGYSRFSFSEDMIAGVEIENVSCDPDHANFRGGLSFES